MSTSPEHKLQELLEAFDVAMLVTRSSTGQLRSRPMALADVDPGGTLWFLTERHSGKIEEIERDSHVNVAMQSGNKFVSISGVARPVESADMIDELWSDAWRTWFPGGKEDPNLVLLEVHGETGEYWDNSGARGIKYLIEAGKAYLTGKKPDVAGDPAIHGKVDMEHAVPGR